MKQLTRREFVKSGTAAAALLSGVPGVHASGQDRPIRIGLVGCGGRGTAAAQNCLESSPNVKLVAMGDLFKEQLEKSRKQLSGREGVEVDDGRAFVGLDAYRKVIDSDIDVVLLATPPGFRPAHFEYAVQQGKHCFVEKPVAVDPVGVRKFIEIGKVAAQKKLAVVAGTQYRHQKSFIETIKRIHDGQIGEVLGGRAYYNANVPWTKRRKPEWTEMEWQMRMWIHFDWLSGDQPVEQHIHTIDVTDWAMNSRPVKAIATGGRQVRPDPFHGNVYDHFTIDYEYPNGRHVMSMCRQMANTSSHVGAYFIGSEGEADIYRGEIRGKNPWKYDGEISIAKAYVAEHAALVSAVRSGQLINESEQVALSTLTAILGREAAYTGKSVTWDEMMASTLDLSPGKIEFGDCSSRPLPMPGQDRA